MVYRPGHAAIDLNAGSALSAIIPSAALAAAIGSFLAWAYLAIFELISVFALGFEGVVAFALSLLLFLTIGTLVGTALCAFYIGLIGAPIAMLLGPRIDRGYSIIVSIIAAMVTSNLAGTLMAGDFLSWEASEKWHFVALLLAYSIPAGLLYRRSVIAARNFSRWAD